MQLKFLIEASNDGWLRRTLTCPPLLEPLKTSVVQLPYGPVERIRSAVLTGVLEGPSEKPGDCEVTIFRDFGHR
jgi:hypothetical protein